MVAALLEKVRSFDYWFYPFDLGNGVVITPTKGEAHAAEKRELRDFVWPAVLDLFGGSLAGLRVLDVACNAGFWALEAHRSGAAEVVGIEARDVFVEQARLVRDSLGIDPARLDYRLMPVERITPDALGEFDLVLLLRILHHLSDPLGALERVRDVSRGAIVVDVRLHQADEPVLYVRSQAHENVSGVGSGIRMTPSRSAIELMLDHAGFDDVHLIEPRPPLEKAYITGKRAVVTARVRDREGIDV